MTHPTANVVIYWINKILKYRSLGSRHRKKCKNPPPEKDSEPVDGGCKCNTCDKIVNHNNNLNRHRSNCKKTKINIKIDLIFQILFQNLSFISFIVKLHGLHWIQINIRSILGMYFQLFSRYISRYHTILVYFHQRFSVYHL